MDMAQDNAAGEPSGKPFMGYSVVFDYFWRVHRSAVEEALDEFNEEIGYDGRPLTDEDHELLGSFAMEWFIFDHRFPNGQTSLDRYLTLQGKSLSGKKCKDLTDAARSQFTGSFWVIGASAAGHTVTLEDVATGERYRINDHLASQSLDGSEGGLLPVRVACIRGQWYFPGNPIGLRPVKPTERMKAMMRDLHNDNPMTFADYVSIEMGFATADDAAAQGAAGDDEGPSPYEIMRSYRGMSPDERAEELDHMRREYEDLRERYELPYSWDGLRSLIDHEGEDAGDPRPDGDDGGRNAATNVLDILSMVMPKGTGMDSPFGVAAGADGTAGRAMPMDMPDMQRLVNLFMRAWNLLPHQSLHGKAPIEVDPGDAHDGLFDEERLYDDEPIDRNAGRPGAKRNGFEGAASDDDGYVDDSVDDYGRGSIAYSNKDHPEYLKNPVQWWHEPQMPADSGADGKDGAGNPDDAAGAAHPGNDDRWPVRCGAILNHYSEMRGIGALMPAYESFDMAVGADDPESRVDMESDAYVYAGEEWIAFSWTPERSESWGEGDPLSLDDDSAPKEAFDDAVNGLTPIEFFVANPPEGADPALVERYRQVAASQLVSLFWVRGVVPDKRRVTVEDVQNGTLYTLTDERLSAFLAPTGSNVGLLGMRIAKVNGQWMMPTEPALSLPIAVDDGWRQLTRSVFDRWRDELANMWDFEALLCEQLDDITDDRTLKQYYRMPFTASKIAAATGAERERLEAMADRADTIRDQYLAARMLTDVLVTWEDMAVAIWRSPIRQSADDLFEELFDTMANAHILDIPPARAKLHEVFVAAWRALPHRAFGNQTPAEAGMGPIQE